jgi:hypothetical protein
MESEYAEVLNGFIRMLGFGRVHADEAHPLTVFHHQRVTIDHTLCNTVITVNRTSAVGNIAA